MNIDDCKEIIKEITNTIGFKKFFTVKYQTEVSNAIEACLAELDNKDKANVDLQEIYTEEYINRKRLTSEVKELKQQLELKDKEIQELKKQMENYCQDCLDRV